MQHTVQGTIAGRVLSIETGRVATQASGACLARYGDTVVLATVVGGQKVDEERGFLPLLVDYREKTYAAGKIPGGFFKREGRPNEKEILSARLIDRSLRPLFDNSFRFDIQVTADVLSSDQENDSDVLALVGASTAVVLSDVPFPGPVSAVRIGKIGERFVLNPTFTELEGSTMDLIVAGTSENIVMVEGEAREISEAEIVEALDFALPAIREINRMQRELVALAGTPKREVLRREIPDELREAIAAAYGERVQELLTLPGKEDRQQALTDLRKEGTERFAAEYADNANDVGTIIEELERQKLRWLVLDKKLRADGRGPDEIRPVSCQVGFLPRTHGSALFTRGQTQALVVTTLGTSIDEQRIEELEGQSWKTFMLHYNFPAFSVGEVRPNRGPSRREIGHGALAERALSAVIPSNESFPYTIRIVSDILESNGSSSMATVCGGSLSLMDAGVPVPLAVAGIAMGLVKEDDRVILLSDILGIEDHLGDMDLKVTGTRRGITAVQMDIKVGGIDSAILRSALDKARDGRLKILDVMDEAIGEPRAQLSPYAPRISVIQIPPDRIRDVIGPGGRTIKKITDETGATVDIEDSGQVKVACVEEAMAQRAIEIIRALTEDPEVGRVYNGKVVRIANFGCFVEILPGRDGLVHISELDKRRVNKVEDVVREGDLILVKVIGIDEEGKIKLSRKQALMATASSGSA